jgi:hypothetical protein
MISLPIFLSSHFLREIMEPKGSQEAKLPLKAVNFTHLVPFCISSEQRRKLLSAAWEF